MKHILSHTKNEIRLLIALKNAYPTEDDLDVIADEAWKTAAKKLAKLKRLLLFLPN